MTPKDKAKDLVTRFYKHIFTIDNGVNTSQDESRLIAAKLCAIEHVTEIINANFGEGYNHQFWTSVLDELVHT